MTEEQLQQEVHEDRLRIEAKPSFTETFDSFVCLGDTITTTFRMTLDAVEPVFHVTTTDNETYEGGKLSELVDEAMREHYQKEGGK